MEVLAIAVKQEKQIQGISIRKEEVKRAGDTVIYIENIKEIYKTTRANK